MIKVIIADDSPIVRARLVSMVYELDNVDIVGLAEDAGQTLSLAARCQPDVLVLDIQMPGGGGLEVLRQLREFNVKRTVIVLSNHTNDQYRKRCLELGAAFFFSKTTEFDQVIEVLKTLAETRYKAG